jgi:hypothetical protein
MIQRDRNMQRLGLHCVEELPKPGWGACSGGVSWGVGGEGSAAASVQPALDAIASTPSQVHLCSSFAGLLPSAFAATPAVSHTCCRAKPTLHLPAVLVEVLQDACALLECRQPLELCAAIKPVQDLAALVPRMERFIGDTCGVRFRVVGQGPAWHARLAVCILDFSALPTDKHPPAAYPHATPWPAAGGLSARAGACA